jgi:hypothetical protein
MLYLKKICLVIFIIITILFTVGYITQPIFIYTQQQITPTQTNGPILERISQSFYITPNIFSNNYSNLSNDVNTLLKILFLLCIVITILLIVGIVLAYIGFRFISKVLFFIAMILMIGLFIIIQIIILTDSFISNISNSELGAPNISNGNGYYLILVSVILMIINYLLSLKLL